MRRRSMGGFRGVFYELFGPVVNMDSWGQPRVASRLRSGRRRRPGFWIGRGGLARSIFCWASCGSNTGGSGLRKHSPAPTTISSPEATRRCVWTAGFPQRMQMASSLVISSATASRRGIGFKGTAHEVGVEPWHDHALSHVRELDATFDDGLAQELGFVDADDFGARGDFREDRRRRRRQVRNRARGRSGRRCRSSRSAGR